MARTNLKWLDKAFVKARCAARESLAYIREDINDIIDNNITSEPRIETALDSLITCLRISGAGGEKEFKRLNGYYAGINKENSDFYRRSYQEIVKE
ncbi:MAG TPA: hypothetical protein VJA18_03875 [Candidatus Nanoarchaeia archaeon]|nr:hypothetical protein [Candidatus Nanoarchaeia archaeon]